MKEVASIATDSQEFLESMLKPDEELLANVPIVRLFIEPVDSAEIESRKVTAFVAVTNSRVLIYKSDKQVQSKLRQGCLILFVVYVFENKPDTHTVKIIHDRGHAAR